VEKPIAVRQAPKADGGSTLTPRSSLLVL